jgi:CubicO group peptidase (beta-lactamase class C family)
MLSPPTDARARAVRERLDRMAVALPGIQYAMTDANALRFEHCAGAADVGAERPVSPSTLFMAASCTKVVTAAAVMALVEGGKLALDGSLNDTYADHPYGPRITIRQLLAHTAGVPNPLPVNWLHRIDDATFDEDRALASVLRAHPRLQSRPGERYRYSNLGYWLLGKAIERASGLPYCLYVEQVVLPSPERPSAELSFAPGDPSALARGYERAWSPLGMFARVAVRASLRDGRDGPWLRFARVAMDGAAYGGLFATARGFCGFLRKQLAGGHSEPLGWRAGTLGGVPYLGKPGGGPGFCGNVRLYPRLGFATAWFANRMAVQEAKIVALTDAVDEAWVGAAPGG